MEHIKKNFYSIATLICGGIIFIFNGGAGYGDMKKDVSTIKATTTQLSGDVSELKKTVTSVQIEQSAMGTDIKNLRQEITDWKADTRADKQQPKEGWSTITRKYPGGPYITHPINQLTSLSRPFGWL